MSRLSEIRVDAGALRHNLDRLKTLLPPSVKVAAVVKGNAYGHGLHEVVSALDGHVDAFQVDDIEELWELRRITPTRALVFGYISDRDVAEAISLDAELGVWDVERLRLIAAVGRPVKIHVEVDALLGRLGVMPPGLAPLLDAIATYPSIQVTGVYAHFANIEDTTDLGHAQAQLDVFRTAATAVTARWPGASQHISATSGVMTIEQDGPPHDLVRIGIGLYGLYPSAALGRSCDNLALRPALTWATRLAQVKTVPARHPIGYGLTYVSRREMRIGIVPQGYSDGYDRGLSNSGEVLVAGRRCPVIGRVAMNMFAVDLTPAPEARAEDEVILLGRQGEEEITADELAARLGTIHYEVVSRISPSLLRRLVG